MTATMAAQQAEQQAERHHPQAEPDSETDTEMELQTQAELSEIFYVENRRRKHNIKIQVKLCEEGVYLRRETTQSEHVNKQLIRIEDIIGSSCGQRLKKRARGGLNSCKNPNHDTTEEPEESQQPPAQQDNSAYLYIYAYLKKDKPLRRVQTLRILRFRSSNSYSENLNTAKLWHRTIREYKQRSGEASRADAGKKLLILLNPKSGSGKGRELFQKQVAPLLREAEAQYDLQITTHPQYALEFVRSRKDLLERYSGIVVASGDGLFYEVLNGLMDRMDWRRACRELSLGIIPCGSGNGLAKSIAHHCNEPYDPKPILNATLICVAGRATPMDIMRVELNHKEKHLVMYAFLSVGWGLIADIDIESETLRRIGAQRFTLWAIKRLITLRSYKGKLYYLPGNKEAAADIQTQKTETDVSKPVSRAASSRYSLPNAASTARANNEFMDLPDELEFDVELRANQGDEQFADAQSLDRSTYKPNTDSWHSAVSRRTAYYSIGGQSTRSNRSRLSVVQKIEAANAEFNQLVPTGTIPSVQLPLSADQGWIMEDGEFVMVHAACTTHLASDCFFAPDSRLNDGLIYLVIIRAGVGRPQLLNFLLSMNSGTHLPTEVDPYIAVVPVRAFRIEPTGNNGILTLDGERVDYGPIQAEVFPGLINVMTTTG